MQRIRDLTSSDLVRFGRIVALLERSDDDEGIREKVFGDIVRLTRADTAVSYIWNESARCFAAPVVHNMDPVNLERYQVWYQFRDPITFKLRERRRATHVAEVMPYTDLYRTEFYNDFLVRDGHHHGINMFLFEGNRDLGDFRLWRNPASEEFGDREIGLLDALAPFLKRSLARQDSCYALLTQRERAVANLVARGCRDRDIAALLGISFSTVRTHLNRAMEKKGCANRAELAAAVMRAETRARA